MVKQPGIICSVIDAKNDNVYYSIFEKEHENYNMIHDFSTCNILELIHVLKAYKSGITFVGDGSVFYQKLLMENLSNSYFLEQNDENSYFIGLAGLDKYKKGKESSLSPLYLRPSNAERIKEEQKK